MRRRVHNALTVDVENFDHRRTIFWTCWSVGLVDVAANALPVDFTHRLSTELSKRGENGAHPDTSQPIFLRRVRGNKLQYPAVLSYNLEIYIYSHIHSITLQHTQSNSKQ